MTVDDLIDANRDCGVDARASIVEARFAGGPIIVEADNEYTGDDSPGVRLEMPGHSVWLFAREARALGEALLREADTASSERRELRPDPRVEGTL